MSRSDWDVVVIGAGLVGLASAWRAAQRGLRVLVLDRAEEPGAGASGVAAGMLAPVTEADFGEQEAVGANLAAREAWPGFAAELEELSGRSCGLRETGALLAASDRDEAEELRRLHEFQRGLGLAAEWLTPGQCRELEPGLSPRVAGGILAHGEASVDPRLVLAALRDALERAGGELRAGAEVLGLERDGDRVTGVATRSGTVGADSTVLAAGAWSARLAAELAVRPVKGQILELRVRGGPDPLGRILRAPRCYLVPRGDGRVVLGATVEEQGFDTGVTAGGVLQLLEAAWELVPEVAELELVAAHAGLRPGTPDNRPLVGPAELEGLVLATGHYRGGVLLAPVTARTVAALLAGDEPPPESAAWSPARFEAARA